MRVACVGYRDWALKIYDELAQRTDHTVLIIRSREQYDDRSLVNFKPDLVLFYGWSWMVKPAITKSFDCIMLHPSALPKYRGGSPIQNQIIAGETNSAVTLFIMNEDMDAGDVIAQEEISLEGYLDEIFAQITEVGLRLTVDILKNGYSRIPQDHSQATYYKRRKPEESEITPEELTNSSARYLYNKVRMLEDPYPNAFIRTADGLRLLIKKTEIGQA